MPGRSAARCRNSASSSVAMAWFQEKLSSDVGGTERVALRRAGNAAGMRFGESGGGVANRDRMHAVESSVGEASRCEEIARRSRALQVGGTPR